MTVDRGAGRATLDASAAREIAGELLARRPWTVAALVARLRRRGAPADVARAVIDELVARGHLDDKTFCRQWVDARAGRGYGPARLRAELRARGVARALIDEALASAGPHTSIDRARALASRRLTALDGGSPDRRAVRLRDFLVRRGYGVGLATRVARELTGVDRPRSP